MTKPSRTKTKAKEDRLSVDTLLQRLVEGYRQWTPEQSEAMGSPHHPDVFLIGCIDSRFQPNRALDYGPGEVLEYRPIAAVVPPPDKADDAFLARMAFRRLKEIDHIIIIAHSDCGGAQAAISVPDPNPASGSDLDRVAHQAHRTGLPVSTLSRAFLKAANGDTCKAGNGLAKAISVQSLKNVLLYKGRAGYATIGDEVKAGKAHVAVLYYDLGHLSVQQYDLKTNTWQELFAPPASTSDPGKKTPAGPPTGR